MAEAPRRRSTAPADEVAAVLRGYVRSPRWFQYSENLRGPMNVQVLTAHKAWLSQLVRFSPNLSFKQSHLCEVFGLLLDPKWNLTKDQSRDWVTTMAKRVRTAGRHSAGSTCSLPDLIYRLLDIGGNGWKRLETVGNGWKRLET
eukprot:9281609-Alexandrium_andersonii.AAC.1